MNNISVQPLNQSVEVSISCPQNPNSVSFIPTENSQFYSELAKKYKDEAAESANNAQTKLGEITTSVNTGIATINNHVNSIENDFINSVNSVASNLTKIDAVNSNKTNIDTVANNISNISTVLSSISNVNTVANNINEISTVSGSNYEISQIANNLNNINGVASDITKINTVYNNITPILTAANNISDIASISECISNINTIANNIENISTVSGSIANITTISGSIAQVNTVGNNIDKVATVSGSINQVATVSGSISQIATVSGSISQVSTVSGSINQVNTVSDSTNLNKITTVANNITNVNRVGTDITNVNTVANNIDIIDDLALEIDRIDQSKGKKTGTISTNNDILQDIKSYAHSTFDADKFTTSASWSGTITHDGIASGFSNDNYIYFTKPENFYITNFEISFKKEPQKLGMIFSTDTYNIFCWFYTNDNFYLAIRNNSNQDVCSIRTNDTRIYDAEIVKIKFVGENSIIYADGVALPTTFTLQTGHTLDEITTGNFTSFLWGRYLSADYFKGYFDLKYLTITSNNIHVFSGNKTGIDTIKPDDYTTSATPSTISDDGIVSNITYQNYIKLNSWVPVDYKTLELYLGKFTFTNFSNDQYLIYAYKYTNSIHSGLTLAIDTHKNAKWSAGSGAADYDIAHNKTGSITYNRDDEVEFKLVFNGTRYTLYSSVNGAAWQVDSYVDSTLKIDSSITNKLLGCGNFVNSQVTGTVNLNSVKIYANGNLIYQPCLKIPYTESKTGSKIVYSYYRDRVSDMYEQFGYAPYYTLSDSDFTLPMGEIYGLIGSKTLRNSYRNGSEYLEIYSDNTLEQGGNCTSGTEIVLLKPFKDNNYILTVPYSAKTSTAFTPTQSGTWIAKGEY